MPTELFDISRLLNTKEDTAFKIVLEEWANVAWTNMLFVQQHDKRTIQVVRDELKQRLCTTDY